MIAASFTMSSIRYFIVWATGIITIVASQSLPYNPTSILHDPINKNIAYIFQHNADSSAHQLDTLDLSSTLSASNITFSITSPELPFTSGNNAAFTPFISDTGDITVYTGSCQSTNSSALWTLTNPNSDVKNRGRWTQSTTHAAADMMSASLPGAYYLSKAFSFSPLVDSNTSETNFYLFGGMCPKSGSTTTNWQTTARYSNSMLRLSPQSDMNYTLEVTSSRSSPVAEAGFSLTGLTPTFSNNSNVRIQQKNFMVIGGHTPTAFISMSQVAIWSLPEEAWNFVKVEMPSTAQPSSEIAVDGSTNIIDSRSGHSAVLTEDGTKVIIYGGWVGDVSQAAEPQLAILHLGTGYGGSGHWEWSVPADQPSGGGIYGHGATMLPGNVMMILGGYDVGPVKRDEQSGMKAMFFNATSQTWSTNYSNPEYLPKEEFHQSSPSSLGVRIAVGLSLAAVAASVLLCVGYKRHQKHKDSRDGNIRDLSAIASSSHRGPDQEMRSSSDVFPWSHRSSNRDAEDEFEDNHSDTNRIRYEHFNPGVHGNEDSPYILPPPSKQITPIPSYSRLRGSYQPANHELGNLGIGHGTAGAIHPIYEADENDEEDENAGDLGLVAGQSFTSRDQQNTKRHSDPFKDPLNQRASNSRQSMTRSVQTPDSDTAAREQEIQDWVSEWAAADVIMSSQTRSHSSIGQVSPTRQATVVTANSPDSVAGEEDGRSISNLSEQTEKSLPHSNVVAGSINSQHSRENSVRSFGATITHPFGTSHNRSLTKLGSGITLSPPTLDRSLSPLPPALRVAPGSSHSSRSGKSFRSAQTSVLPPTNEDEHLLPRPSERPMIGSLDTTEDQYFTSGSPSKLKANGLGKRNTGWLGSLRKVFVAAPDHDLLNPNGSDPRLQGTENYSTPPLPESLPGRDSHRPVSSSGTLWRRKQGRGDGDDYHPEMPAAASGRSYISDEITPNLLNHDGNEDDDDGDDQSSAEKRLVKVMFSVPKEKLRIVNQEEQGSSTEDDDDSKWNTTTSLSERRHSVQNLTIEEEPSNEESLVVEPPKDYREEGIVSKNKGKEKVGGYSRPFVTVYQPLIEDYEDGDLSIARDEDKPTRIGRDRSPVSSASKASSRKSRVLEIVERMEALS
ncbi:unnamed protein product [Blumeria hordei]|uniref:Uncharacterized protein n=1 Tax=Blumeria hordei TaxID=2867405 RepID=A0A383UY47_BLUHO|nr:unnamed protein product [Blumeria hordei]